MGDLIYRVRVVEVQVCAPWDGCENAAERVRDKVDDMGRRFTEKVYARGHSDHAKSLERCMCRH